MTTTIPGEQQLVFDASDATEFRALLGRILADSPLSCGQISIKTGMPRSTAYSLPDTKRPGLPSNPDQVRAFVKACGLTPTQIDLVMDLWTKLHRATENVRSSGDKAVSAATTSPTGRKDAADLLQQLNLAAEVEYQQDRIRSWDGDDEYRGPAAAWWTKFGATPPYSHKTTSWTELLHYVLGDERRTRRAVILLIPVTVLLLGIVCALAFLAVKMPTTMPLVVAGLLSPLLFTLRRNVRKPRKVKGVD
ncbi:hypothetical protein [Amycolatopsis regifaucium]|uniref:Uncharacterized protein n=1 Tax=Amycolatopsis regifaucium TaxID=546365 RepID=A0A154MRH7_9PSEU|nr:hypothetical protein [Amycolatopsis regifaucium]KZB86543.1 hypothetical protein AVL48_26235 [Amycolatopsis regifaucium]OKA03488.1 hypothetical protein ATP06_0235880 [Amycolatopsis regifaucium]SFJ15053.1 hypothetical protein SAMN04489731_11653 [Amycolatopsis regifaucium]